MRGLPLRTVVGRQAVSSDQGLVGALARRHGCPVDGSTSAAHLLALHGIADQAVVVEPHRPYEIGPFTVRSTPSRHSKRGHHVEAGPVRIRLPVPRK